VTMNGYKVKEIWWLSGIENFVSERGEGDTDKKVFVNQ